MSELCLLFESQVRILPVRVRRKMPFMVQSR